MKKKFVPALGISDFQKLRTSTGNFIDKSLFIRDILAEPTEVLLFPRPRRFGKTTNLSMLGYFLRKTNENLAHLFDDLVVSRDADTMKHFQKYPVISISFKDVKGETFEAALAGIRARITEVYREHRHLLEEGRLDSTTTRFFRNVLDEVATIYDLQQSFLVLSRALHEHHGQRVVILIDEYDTPMHTAYIHGYFDQIVTFFRVFLSACLKDNNALFKGVLTGILRVSRENMFSGLNNIEVYSILAPAFSTHFGFTEDEVGAIIEPDKLDEVRRWYDGYRFGENVIYNPWSILNYIKHGVLRPYWVNTGSSDLIELLAAQKGLALSDPSYALLRGETIDVRLDDNIVLRNIERSTDALWNFLLFSGYLKIQNVVLDEGRTIGTLCIPNKEIRLVYEDMFRHWVERVDRDWAATKDLVKALLNGDAATAEDLLEHILVTAMSYQDPAGREPEKLYHGFVLGLLVHLESRYDVRSNRESGYGRADILMRPKTPGQPGVVMEFKVPAGKETHESALISAAKQIRDRKYATEVLQSGAGVVYEYAMAFDGKKAWVRRVDDLLPA